MTEPKLTQNEQSLQDAVESGDYGPMVTHERRKELEAAESHTSEKDKRINIRTPNRDLSAIQAKATEEGIPFQARASTYSDSDQNEMESLFVRTFSASEGKAEGALVGRLVHDLMTGIEAGDIYGFIASDQDKIVGCIFFTRLSFDSPVKAFLLAPVAVDTDYQGKGVGQKLINFGIDHLADLGVELIFTYGDPNYYSRVGFKQIPQKIARAPFELSHPEGWLCRSLNESNIEPLPGRARCVGPFNNREYW